MTIAFNNADDVQHCYETNGANVVVQVQPRSGFSHGSSMVKLKNIIGYKWEKKDYPGHLIAIHKDGKVIAYSINVNGQGMVRLIHFGMGNKRALIKGMSKEVLDLQFADYSKEIIIGCIEESALHINRLDVVDGGDSLNCTQLLKIENPIEGHVPIMDKISWCPYVPEENDTIDEFSVMLLVWVRGNKFECYSIKTIIDNYNTGVIQAENITEGLVRSYDNQRALITHATYSPDGTTLAISTIDGFIKFFQIYFHETIPRCLHAWKPHDGAAISSFFFLDNHTQPIAGSTLWKYAVTLAANNTEIKVSKCDNWKTLQTITFKSSIGQPLAFKAEIDRTSSYLILSDMTNRQMYVLQILKENALSQQNGSEEHHNNGDDVAANAVGGISRVFVKSIAEFRLASTILSYGISNASIRRYKCALSDNYLIDELEDYDEENNSLYCVVLRLFMILPESVQECHILYQPALNESAEILNTEVKDSKLNIAASSSIDTKKAEPLTLMTPPQKTSQINLLTPDSFSSPVVEKQQKDVSQDVLSTIFMLAKTNQAGTTPGVANKSHENVLNLTNVSLIEEEKIFQQKLPVDGNSNQTTTQAKSGAASGGSSPSREVRDILLQADSVNEDYYPGEESDDLEIEEEQNKDVLNALNALDVDFKNIDDDDDDDEDDGNEEDDEDDEPIVTVKPTKSTPHSDWPKAPQFMDTNSVPATSKQVETLSTRMNQMIEIMETQSRYIAELRNEIYDLKASNVAEAMVIDHKLDTVEEQCKKTIEQNFVKFENSLMMKDKREITESIMQLFQQLSRTQLNGIETAVKENLLKVCTHKGFIESISHSMLIGIQNSLEQTFRKSLEEIMIPSYEKITHEMFQEMGKAFTTGTKEYTRAFDNYMKQYGAVQFQMTEFSGAIHQIPQQVRATTEQSVLPMLNSGFVDIRQRLEKFQSKVINDVKEQVRNEIQNGFERQTMTLEDSVLSVVQRSQAETPAPTIYDQRENIKQLLAHDQIDKAFHQALISSDLSLLEFTLENADYQAAFNPCPLQQSVLLSLIQQLTADMGKFSELKLRYLSDAVLALNIYDVITKEHAPKILRELNNTLNAFTAANPKYAFNSNLRMITFAAESKIKSNPNI
ncbi:CLUMA_CG004770, isoform A [Clunio marinus]|uniref:CLUMA_CG004770, isoform A n=1 Tax=Clunio marinus TaxID=568069 RepID=A0A1J1HU48_9DIPT|nr:CLUMA_CG004770, isoform A [Clunio marinus]